MKRNIYTLLTIILLAGVSTTVNTQILLWPDGLEFTTFGPNEAITIDIGVMRNIQFCGPDGFDDIISPYTDIYIVPSGSVSLGDELEDISGVSPNTVLAPSPSGVFVSETIGFVTIDGAIVEGLYDVIYDECQDGVFDGLDTKFEGAFQVVFPLDVPPIAPYIIDLKQEAAEEAFFFLAVFVAQEGALNIMPELIAYSECVNMNNLDCPFKLVADKVKDEADNVNLAKYATIQLGASWNSVWKMKLLWEIAENHLENAVLRYNAIAADPPDLDFMQLTFLENREILFPSNNDPITVSIANLGSAVGNESEIALALLKSLERYQGADIENNLPWAITHARGIRDFSRLLAMQLPYTKATLQQFLANVINDPNDYEQVAGEAESLRNRFVNSGFNQEEVQFLKNLGYSESEIENFKTSFSEDSYDYSQVEFQQAIDGLVNQIDQTIVTLYALANDMEGLISSLESDVINENIPVANAGGPYSGTEGTTINFDGSASTSPSSIILYEWDFDGDGEFDDGVGATPQFTYNQAFQGIIGLKVTNSENASNVDYAILDVTNVNDPPIINGSSPSIDPEIFVGNSETFSVTVSDPENDPFTIEWYLDAELVGSGESFTYTPASNDVGIRVVDAIVIDANPLGDITFHSWGVKVFREDNDGDGWNANVDCNDNDPNLYPGLPEITLSSNPIELFAPPGETSSEVIVINNTSALCSDLNYAISSIIFNGPDPFVDQAGSSLKFNYGENRYRGNVYSVSEWTTLTKIESHLNFTGARELNFVVLEGDNSYGPFTRVHTQTVTRQGTGKGFYSSDSFQKFLTPGKYYIAAVGWKGGNITFYWNDASTSPEPISFGQRINGYAVNGFPIGNVVNVPLLSPAYYQRLTTKDTWLRIAPTLGSITQETTMNINITADATGLADGAYQGELLIASNDPNASEVQIPVTLNVATDNLAIMPDGPFNAQGPSGGPFSPSCQTYTLTNDGLADLNWAASCDTPWMEALPSNGLLGAGASVNVEICLAAAADALAEGNYVGECLFENVSAGTEHVRAVNLTVEACLDEDGDGVSVCEGDCDDESQVVYPGATELCDGLDNDCDGEIDEGPDVDGDGATNCNDGCPNDPDKTAPGICGCGTPDTDSDGDGYIDCIGPSDNKALDFIGGPTGDYIQFSNKFLFHDPGDATLEFWVKKYTSQDQSILWTGFPGEDRDRYNILTSSAGVCFDYREPNGNISGHVFGCTGFFANDTWVHVALVRSGNTYYKYLNGELAGTAVDNNPNLPTYAGWRISGRLGYSHTRFNGFIDDLRLWSHARTQAEIQADMNKELQGCEPGLFAYYPFNEDAGNIVFDKTSNANHGVFMNGGPIRSTNTPLLFSNPDSNIDNDGDGFSECQGDCDDDNPSLSPGSPELCNGIDDNCNGLIDDGLDVDGDGFLACQGDCDDDNPNVYPGASELCNGVDDNCDGQADEGAICDPQTGFNNSLQLDGVDDYVDLSEHVQYLMYGQPATIEFWLKSNLDHRTDISTLWAVSDGVAVNSGGQRFNITYGTHTGGLSNERISALHWRGYTDDYSLQGVIENGDVTGEWHHYAVVCNGSTWSFYIDGLHEVTTQSNFGVSSYNGYYADDILAKVHATIGRFISDVPDPYPINGNIDEFRLWNTARTASEIQDNYTRSFNCHPPGLVAYYKFDETENLGQGNSGVNDIRDYSGNNFHGDVIGGATVVPDAAPVQATALHFDGINDYVEIPDNPALDFATELTFEAWIKPDQVTALNILTKEWCAGGQFAYYINILDGKIKFVWDENGVCGDGSGYGTDDAVVQTGIWQHIAVTYSLNGAEIYVNGAEMPGSLTGSYTPIHNSNRPMILGAYRVQNGSLIGFYEGAMAELRAWDYVRTEAQIANAMNCRLTGNEPGLSAYYLFEDGIAGGANNSAATLSDLSPNSLDGTLVNFSLSGSASNWSSSVVELCGACLVEEICNGIDDDGDGQVDEGVCDPPDFLNNALHFDGSNDWVYIGDNPLFSPGVITVEAWVKPDYAGAFRGVATKRNCCGGTTEEWTMQTENGKMGFHALAPGCFLVDPNPLPIGVWTHYAATYDGQISTLYKNGDIVDQRSSSPGSIPDLSWPVYIGGRSGAADPWPGAIDEVRIWDHALPQCEIIANMNCELTGNESGLIAYYNFNQGVAGGNNAGFVTLADLSPNGLNGTLQNMSLSGTNSNWIASEVTINENCPYLSIDSDNDGQGDECDPFPFDAGDDNDEDGIAGISDNCPDIANADQTDTDGDGLGDACDPCPLDPHEGVDGDGVCSDVDNCPDIMNPNQADSDTDGPGDACDPCPLDPENDTDNDGICGNDDNCPYMANSSQTDSDGDGIGDACDNCPDDPFNDIDGDGICGDIDNCPFQDNPGQSDLDGDGFGDPCDPIFDDVDSDGIADLFDNCADTPNPGQEDSDCDGFGDACDQCPGGNDGIDTYGDTSVPDCAEWIGIDELPDDWRCGNNGNKVTICHVPPGNPANANILCVSPNAVPAHLAHGDYLGPCFAVACNGSLETGGAGILSQSILPEAAAEPELLLYPNPASGKVNVVLKHFAEVPSRLVVYNYLGQACYQLDALNASDTPIVIDFESNDIPPGWYMVAAHTSRGIVAKPLVAVKQ
ncbi:MAG: thrombospondin type 3 repeat-containing protein [Phaeodactylibacter sp.]|nr:thrombospondin type 3 repeat-containing protein [Phaeodactylibacter sp.]